MPRDDTGGSPAIRRTSVSIVIPVKDDTRRLRSCLSALQGQTLRADELIVVDNGSADSSADVGHATGAKVIRCDQPGIAAAAAAGYDKAVGDVILRLDADCVPSARWVETMVDAFDARPDVSVVTGGAHFVDGPRPLRDPLALVYLAGYALVCGPALGHLPLFGSNLGFRRSAWRSIRSSIHRVSPEMHDDLDLSFHFGERHRIRYVSGATMGISMRPFSNSRAFVRRVARGARTVVAHWPSDFPPVRWVRLALRRILHRLRVPVRRSRT